MGGDSLRCPQHGTVGRARRLVSGLTVTALLAALPALGVTTSVARADDTEPPTSEASAALEQAAASGEEVEVVGAREEYATTHANPDGYSFTLTAVRRTGARRTAGRILGGAGRDAGAPGRRVDRAEGVGGRRLLLRRW